MQIIPSLDSGGAERSTLEIAAALAEAGARPLVATQGGRWIAKLEPMGAQVVRLPLRSKNPLTVLINGFRLAGIVRREGVRVLHVRSRAPAFSAWMAARLSGAVWMATYHGFYSANGPFKRWYNGIMTRGAAVIANSAFTARHVAETYPKARPRLVTIPRGVDLETFDPAAVPQTRVAALRQAWGIPEPERIVLVPGRITAWKGQETVIEAFRALKAAGQAQNLVAVLIGDTQSSAQRRTLAGQIAKHGLERQVRLAGHCADMPAAYLAADLVLQASHEPEAFGRVAAEAQAMGAIVIASDIGAAREVVRTGPEATGFLVPPGDAGALAQAIRAGLGLAPEARAQMSARAIAHIREHFGLASMCARTLAVYAQLLEPAR